MGQIKNIKLHIVTDIKMACAKRKFCVAIVGIGRAGGIHIGNCQRNIRIKIKYIVDIDTEKASKVKDEYILDDTRVIHADRFDDVLNDTEVDGVIIATVTYSHEEYVNKCIQAKKAIFCEKPIASNLLPRLSITWGGTFEDIRWNFP